MNVEPRATYRVQLRREFDFDAAAGIVPYLAALGVSHLYCSPYMQAAAGSAHGYDVVDPTRVNGDLGGDEGLARMSEVLAHHGMSQLIDIVPNHMCISDARDVWWWDTLLHGRDGAHAAFFDIDWNAPGLEGRVLLPVLGKALDEVLARDELQLVPAVSETHGDSGAPLLAYYDQRFPLNPAPGVEVGDEGVRQLLAHQHYVLDDWRTGLTRINYRRFFDITSLAAVRAERDDVHRTTHQRALELVAAGVVDGLRIDHVDGLRDPAAYAARLRAEAPGTWLIAEKILQRGERLPRSWRLDGTSGYDTAARLTALHVDRGARDAMHRTYTEYTGDTSSFAVHAREGRLLALDTLLSADLDRLTRAATAAGIPGARPELRQLIAAMPVYRLYPQEWEPLRVEDAVALDEALRIAGPHSRVVTLTAIADLLRAHGPATAPRAEVRTRIQQLSASATAKGVEDTAFYRHVPLVALNEVGADPSHFGIDTEAFHHACHDAAEAWPVSLVATATHDTKRGEDARLRVAMLSEMPDAWADAVSRWHHIAMRHRRRRAPSATAAYLFFQTMVAAHPISVDRCIEYMRKAAREAKQQTSWLDPDAEYEAQLDAFVRGMLGDREFIADVDDFLRAMTPAWQIASLSQTLLKCVIPGVPDIYQGCELWDLSLVDPDNRRTVDYGRRGALLQRLDQLDALAIMRRRDSGLPKMHVIREALAVRARRPSAFGPGSAYLWVGATGTRAEHAVISMRGAPGSGPGVAAIAVRLAHRLGVDWQDTSLDLPPGDWLNVLTGESVRGGANRIARILDRFPVALLERVT